MLSLNNLSKIYRTIEIETVALDSVNIQIDAGEFAAVMGPSGCGKSTLLNIVGMLDNPTSGQYVFNGEDVSEYPETKLADIRKRNIGFIFQSFNLIDELTVYENVELALLYHNIPSRDRAERVAAWKRSAFPTAQNTCRVSSRAANSNAWQWRVRWSATRA